MSEKMSEKLRECPFCGHEARLEHNGIRTTQNKDNGDLITAWKVCCSNCGTVKGPYTSEYYFRSDETLLLKDAKYNDGRAKAIEAWNRRAENDQARTDD